MPKQELSKTMVVDAAFELLREEGQAALTAKSIAERLGASVQPVYWYCKSMDGLLNEVEKRVRAFISGYIARVIEPQNFFCSLGHAYASLAAEEPHLFAFFMTRPRKGIHSLDELYAREANPGAAAILSYDLGISEEEAKKLHLHMIIYTMGLGALCAASASELDPEQAFSQLDEAWEAFRTVATGKGETQ